MPRIPRKADEENIPPKTLTLALDKEFREECQKIADMRGLSLNAWIRGVLQKAINIENDDEFAETLGNLKDLIKAGRPPFKNTDSIYEGITKAIAVFSDHIYCPKCDKLNYPLLSIPEIELGDDIYDVQGDYHCWNCGYNLELYIWDKLFAKSYMEYYSEKYPILDDSKEYSLTTLTDEEDFIEIYALIKVNKHSKTPIPEIVALIHEKELEEGKKYYLSKHSANNKPSE